MKKDQKKNKSRRNQICWFNPPYDMRVKTKVGHKFLALLDKHFPKGHILHPVMNRRKVKVSYRTMPNIGQQISMNNVKILKEHQEAKKAQQNPGPAPEPKYCNCLPANKANCPLDGHCNIHPDGRPVKEVVYGAKVIACDDNHVPLPAPAPETYGGSTAAAFKTRWYAHNGDFRKPEKKTATRLSSHVWDLKDQNLNYKILWKILAFAKSFASTKQICRLCLTEVYWILNHPEDTTLNKRNEFYNYCRHKTQHLFARP